MADSYALFTTAFLHGVAVEEASCAAGRALQIGNAPGLSLPVPDGAPYVARADWVDADTVEVVDGHGGEHVLRPGSSLRIEVGDIAVELQLVPQFELRRSSPIDWQGVLPWLLVVASSTLLTMQSSLLYEKRCEWFGIDCEIAQEHGGSFVSAEYIARLLRQDYAGADEGRMGDEAPPEEGREMPSVWLPAGALGDASGDMGGAPETAPEPVRSTPSDSPPAGSRPAQPLVAQASDATVEAVSPAEPDISDDDDLGVDRAADDPDAERGETPAEEQDGWGVPDWMDVTVEQRENLEIKHMIEESGRRLRIDPNDANALGVLAYYQYLAMDYEAAEETFDRFIEQSPTSSSGYNNKALVYKRREAWDEEEALYQVALMRNPRDATAMNNYAVNLAHQGRYEEALTYMAQVAILDPNNPYADLHRAKIYAAMSDDETALEYLEKSLEGMKQLDTLHHIEFRQDIRIDPAFASLRKSSSFHGILRKYYGKDSPVRELY